MPGHHKGVTFVGVPLTKPSQLHPVAEHAPGGFDDRERWLHQRDTDLPKAWGTYFYSDPLRGNMRTRDQHTGEIEADLASTRLPQMYKPLLPTCDGFVSKRATLVMSS